ncbi:hypothetical protein [Thalassospira profundimaris]|uniref:hypothetical protein n=1 Tax=Thalassospira profundimaris TaxID=502049 RepID=UPI0002872638|nr:hypothetical protein [Thalassospira profundimaris]EKF06908.1 hypothetical protein TH2_17221 [Thalassospira profundimaris WP0211]
MPTDRSEIGVFDIRTAEAFFTSAVNAYKRYHSADENRKSTQDILYVVMVLAHLREWIAPGENFGKGAIAKNAAHQFGIDLFNECPAFVDLLGLCNGTKHTKPPPTEVGGSLNIDDWLSVDDVHDFDNGPATFHVLYSERGKGKITVGFDVCDLIEDVIKRYDTWFGRDSLND